MTSVLRSPISVFRLPSSVLRPRISVIIPCYNCVRFVEATLESVCRQQPGVDLEVIVVDGGSTDGSLEILERYRGDVTHLISEPDDGHYAAVNKGMAMATGDVLCWLNSDDMFMPGALSVVADVFAAFQEVAWITGIPGVWDTAGRLVYVNESVPVYGQKYLSKGEHDGLLLHGVQQESCFWRRSLWQKVGGIDCRYDLAGDFDLWARMAEHAELVTVSTVLGGNRRHAEQRSNRFHKKYFEQVRSIRNNHGGRAWLEEMLQKVPSYRLKLLLRRLCFPGKGFFILADPNGGWKTCQDWISRG